jgi:quercetin dioxygenase-like cupin family protein
LGEPIARTVEFPASAGAGEPREIRILVDEPALKLATVVLRRGTVLPEHNVSVPVTIQALQGTGTVTAAGERFRIDPAHAVVLGPNVPHAVEPDAGTDLVLLVHYLRRGEEAGQ